MTEDRIRKSEKNQPRWKRMMFKGHKVWLQLDGSGQPVVENNKVLIKYRLDHEYQYWVSEKAVEPINPRHLKKQNTGKKPGHPEGSIKRGDPFQAFLTAGPVKEESVLPGSIVIYTDGASSGNPGPAGIGIVMRYGEHTKEISRHIGIATNNIAELMAIKVALEAVRTTDIPVRLYTDSRYCYGLLILGWKPRRNEALVAAIKKLMKRFQDLKIIKVEGHVGIAANEQADRLARAAARKKPRSNVAGL
ncbi:MAG: reverse transcriptase-like protein [Deltaproteobacteria bacterium]|nr:reverse transcriptase-like protein [Deltaproteobacteria bacterium]